MRAAVVALCMLFHWICVEPVYAERPNVILIMTDDMGGWDVGAMGNPVMRTPHIDSLASGGVRMTRFYVSPVCTPTRASLMTGRYNYRTRAIDTFAGRAMMEPDEVTMAEAMRDAGYAAGIFGKWHLGDNYPMRAMDQGFGESLVHFGGGIGQPSDPPGGEGKYTDPVLLHNGELVKTRGYCTDVYFDAAMDWITKNHRHARNFFAYIAPNAPHSPLDDLPKALYDQYRKMDFRPLMVKPPADPVQLAKEQDRLARIFAMIANVDANVGRLIEKLRTLRILDNTLVLFLTDNGPNTRRFVGPLRGMKADIYDGGVRTAFFAHWPRMLRAGTSSDVVAAHIDLLPTVLEACGVAAPAGVRLDGRSILPLLKGEPVAWPARTLFIQTHRGDVPVVFHHFAAIAWPWKLLNASGFDRETLPPGPPAYELYDLADDPGEQRNLVSSRPEIAARLAAEYEGWFRDVATTREANFAPPRIRIGTRYENPTLLTRQNWRRSPGEGGFGSQGTWLLHVEREGHYRVQLRFPPGTPVGTVRVRVQGRELSQPLKAARETCVFRSVRLAPGDVELRVIAEAGVKAVGPWQVEVSGP